MKIKYLIIWVNLLILLTIMQSPLMLIVSNRIYIYIFLILVLTGIELILSRISFFNKKLNLLVSVISMTSTLSIYVGISLLF
jgi:hypothetical protein